MLRENLHEAGEIISNILAQPLTIPGLPKPISLLEAAKMYLEDPASPEFKKMIDTFHQHPAALEIMMQEFKLLAQDLK